MLCSCDTISLSLATDTSAAQKQETLGAAPFHMDTKFRGHTSHPTHDDRERMLEEDL